MSKVVQIGEWSTTGSYLTPESNGLAVDAVRYVRKQDRIFPIHFVWENI